MQWDGKFLTQFWKGMEKPDMPAPKPEIRIRIRKQRLQSEAMSGLARASWLAQSGRPWSGVVFVMEWYCPSIIISEMEIM